MSDERHICVVIHLNYWFKHGALDMSGTRRSNTEVIVDVLEAAYNGANKTRLVYSSNLNFKIIRGYISKLTKSGMLKVNEKGHFVTTEKGKNFVNDYKGLVKTFQTINNRGHS